MAGGVSMSKAWHGLAFDASTFGGRATRSSSRGPKRPHRAGIAPAQQDHDLVRLHRRHRPALWPVGETALRQPLREQPESLVVVCQEPHHLTAPAGEYEDRAGHWL